MSLCALVVRVSVLVAMSILALTAPARAAIPLCLEANTDRGNVAGFRKLVHSEIARHPSYGLVQADCDTRLLAELFHVGVTRFFTVRVEGQIPLRYRIASEAELERRVSEAISRVLRSDPATLAEDPSRISGLDRAARAVLVRGNNSYRLALFQTLARTDTGAAFAPGAAFELLRGSEHLQVFARAAVGGWPRRVLRAERVLRLFGQVDAGLLYEASARANTSGYVGLGAGLALLRFDGRVVFDDAASLEHVDALGATLHARVGVRFLRAFDFDLDVFAIGALPLFATKNPDASLFGDDGVYTPFAQLGLGVGF
jgi:hypothetical protein